YKSYRQLRRIQWRGEVSSLYQLIGVIQESPQLRRQRRSQHERRLKMNGHAEAGPVTTAEQMESPLDSLHSASVSVANRQETIDVVNSLPIQEQPCGRQTPLSEQEIFRRLWRIY